MTIKILWIERTGNLIPTFVPSLRKKGYWVETAPNGKEAIAQIPYLPPDLIVVNTASLRSSGMRICRTFRKLQNRIHSLVPETEGAVLKHGPITLEPKYNLLQLGDNDPVHLTPKLTALLEKFLHHPGEVLERESLYQEIWQTNYVDRYRIC